jgi:hypothetical protein
MRDYILVGALSLDNLVRAKLQTHFRSGPKLTSVTWHAGGAQFKVRAKASA